MEENKKEEITPAAHRAGFVNIVGNPNVGKSTLMNDLVGERISIITSKAQTTRHRIMGIVNTPDYQIVYSDTPGVLKPKYKLQESMLDFSEGALTPFVIIQKLYPIPCIKRHFPVHVDLPACKQTILEALTEFDAKVVITVLWHFHAPGHPLPGLLPHFPSRRIDADGLCTV